ncbi:MAG TPA: type VI secretion system tube protein Hcp [Pirellulales bacterium]|nr:type VI secretion system tube protein Hcp [Pirellulales bacterium]
MAHTDFFLKIKGIEGESTDSKHKNEIDIESWSWGETQSGSHASGGGGGAGKVSMQDFHFTAKISKASPKLMLACASGEHIDEAVLTCRKAGKDQQEYLKITMNGLLVASYQTGGSGHSEIVPVDQVSLNFSKLQVEYKPQDAKGGLGGPVKAGWNVKENKTV